MLALLRLLLPALIPSWRFFETVQPSPRVYWRAADDAEWAEFRPRPANVPVWVMLVRLVWNPAWNEALYAVSLAERLTAEPTAHVERELFRVIAGQAGSAAQIQFRLVFVTRDTSEVTYQSAPRALSEIVL